MNHPIDPLDATLLAAARAGDKDALEALLARHQAQVYRFSRKMCRDPEDAEDVLQDTLLAMARGIRDFRGASSLSTWLYTIARSFCIKKRRGQTAGAAHAALDPAGEPPAAALADAAHGPAEALASKQVEQALERAIRGLEPAYREVLVLRDVEGLTAPEVAEVLGITPQAVKSRLHRARLAVRDRVAPLLGLPREAPAAPGTCPDVLRMFSQHLEDEISGDVCREMERHLATCPRCRGACDSLRRTLALCNELGPATEVPDSVRRAVTRTLKDFLHPGA